MYLRAELIDKTIDKLVKPPYVEPITVQYFYHGYQRPLTGIENVLVSFQNGHGFTDSSFLFKACTDKGDNCDCELKFSDTYTVYY